MHLPGRVGIPPPLLLQGSKRALQRGQELHAVVDAALIDLEQRIDRARTTRLLALQKLEGQRLHAVAGGSSGAGAEAEAEAGAGGIDKNDPMLSWQLLHRPAALREE